MKDDDRKALIAAVIIGLALLGLIYLAVNS